MNGKLKGCLVVIGLLTGFLLGHFYFKESKLPVHNKTVQTTPAITQEIYPANPKTISDIPPNMIPKATDHIIPFTQMKDGSQVGIDAESWSLKNGIASYIVVVLPPDGAVTQGGEQIVVGIVGQHIDCVNHKYQADFSYILTARKNVVQYQTSDLHGGPIKPGSAGAELEEKVCKPVTSDSPAGPSKPVESTIQGQNTAQI